MTIRTINEFAKRSSIPEKLIRAVIRQAGGWENFRDIAEDITSHGAAGGFTGFIYYADTGAFFARYRDEIIALAERTADDLGEDMLTMIKGFSGLRDTGTTTEEIGRTLWGTKDKHDTQVSNIMAWFALEEVARSFVDELEYSKNDFRR